MCNYADKCMGYMNEIRSFALAVNRYRKVVAGKKKQGKSHWVLNEIHLFELAIYT